MKQQDWRSAPWHILLRMRKIAGFLLSIGCFVAAVAQGAPQAAAPESLPRIIKLPPASYPAMALAAKVFGQVELSIVVRTDGNVDSVAVLSGPPMLRGPAVESAKQMQFECANCTASSNQFRILYKYELIEAYTCESPDRSYPRVSQSDGIVTFTGQPAGTCDPSATRVRVAKCLYLWKCGWR